LIGVVFVVGDAGAEDVHEGEALWVMAPFITSTGAFVCR